MVRGDFSGRFENQQLSGNGAKGGELDRKHPIASISANLRPPSVKSAQARLFD